MENIYFICVSFLSSEGYSREYYINRLKSWEVLKILHRKIIWNICRGNNYQGVIEYMRFACKNTERTSHCTLRSPLAKFIPLGTNIKELSVCRLITGILRVTLFLLTRFKFTTGLSVKVLNIGCEETPTRLAS